MSGYFDGPGPEATFKAYLAEGRFMIQRSASTGLHVFYPRVVMPCSGEATRYESSQSIALVFCSIDRSHIPTCT